MTESKIVQVVRITPKLKLGIAELKKPSTGGFDPVLLDLDRKLIVGLITVGKILNGPYSPVGGKPALEEVIESGLVVGGHYFGYPCKQIAGDLWELVPYHYQTTSRLNCTCCGESFVGRQWHNQDAGYSLGDCCVDYCRNRTNPFLFEETYGIDGYTFNINSSKKRGVYHQPIRTRKE